MRNGECRDLMNGVNSPHIWRLFEGRRKKWEGAGEAVRRVNGEAREREREKGWGVGRRTSVECG